jgi:hypothetical protein
MSMRERGSGRARSALSWVSAACVLAAVVAIAPSAAAAEPDDQPHAAGEGEGAYSFTESWGCGVPATLKPFASKKGTLSASEPIRGPAGDFLGRDIGDIWNSLVEWEVPLSGGKTVKVHERALPAFNQVTVNLAAAVEAGLDYTVNGAGTYNPRTIGGSYRFSFHAFGTAIDINSSKNPYRSDNVLITDMPDAFVQAWRDAGFCWGGDWQDVKDPMHFAWMGPESTPGYGDVPDPYPVETAEADFTVQVFDRLAPFGSAASALADGDGDAAADVFRLIPHPAGTLIDYARSSSGYAWCGVRRSLAPGVHIGGRSVIFGDATADGRMDLWMVGGGPGGLTVEIATRASDFASSVASTPGHAVDGSERFVAGDFNRDGLADLYVVRPSADSTVVDIYEAPGFATLAHSAAMPIEGTSSGEWWFSLGDHDLDGGLDLFALDADSGTVHIATHDSGYAVSSTRTASVPGAISDFIVRDFDGDGRVDLQYLTESGRHRAYLGNSAAYASASGWFWPPNFACEGSSYTGLFTDDDGSPHEQDIDVIALAGVTFGCDPPDNTLFCPGGHVTRGQMSAFFARMLDLDDPKLDWFTDDDASVFEADINRIADAAITYGCNPPENTFFCPAGEVTRGQMAAFLARALGLDEAASADYYADDGTSEFEEEINRLREAGVAFGCTLGDEVNYCPEVPIPRDHMATFLARSLALVLGGSI